MWLYLLLSVLLWSLVYAKDEKQMLVTRMVITVIQPKKDWIYSTVV